MDWKNKLEVVPFEITFKYEKWDYSSSSTITLHCLIKNFLIRKHIVIAVPFYSQNLERYQLTRWLYTHVFYYGEATKLQRVLLFFKKKQHVRGAIIKTLFHKTFILELL
jgi:hypothetical protein